MSFAAAPYPLVAGAEKPVPADLLVLTGVRRRCRRGFLVLFVDPGGIKAKQLDQLLSRCNSVGKRMEFNVRLLGRTGRRDPPHGLWRSRRSLS
jgi:hypothetical protein